MTLRLVKYILCGLLLALSGEAAIHEKHQFTVNTDEVVGEIDNLWNVRIYLGEAAPPPERVQRFKEPGIDVLNHVRLMGGRKDGRNEWFKGVDEQGNVVCDFSQPIAHLKNVVEADLTPWIVLDNVPWGMVEHSVTNGYGQCHPADDVNIWFSYVQKFVQELVSEFGPETVSQWRFRVGTEPDLFPKHWAGTKEEYFKHYDYSVAAVESVIPEPIIGPGNMLMFNGAQETKSDRWGFDMLKHCAEGTNYYTGQIGTRICFFAHSYYYNKGARDGYSFEAHWKKVKEEMERYPSLKNVDREIHEYGVITSKYTIENPRTSEWYAGFYAHTADLAYRYGGKKIFNWTQAFEGLPDPWTKVRDVLAEMEGGRRVEVIRDAEDQLFSGVIPAWKEDSLYLLVYSHYYGDMMQEEFRNDVSLNIAGQRISTVGKWSVSELLLDQDHGVFIHEVYKDIEAAGIQPLPNAPYYVAWARQRYGRENDDKIENIINQNRGKYLRLSKPKKVRVGEKVQPGPDGSLRLNLQFKGSAVRFLKLTPVKAVKKIK